MKGKYKVGQTIEWMYDDILSVLENVSGKPNVGTIKEVHEDHILVDCPEINDHCWLDEDLEDSILKVY